MFLNRLKRDIFFYLSNNIKITNYDHEFEYLFQNLVLASRELKNNNNNNAINIIRRSLKKLKISSNALPSIWWIRILKAADYKNNKDINNLDLVVKEAENFDFKLMTWSNWNEIYDLCLRSGLFQLSLPIAKKIEFALNEQFQNSKLTPDELRRSVPIVIRLGNIKLMKWVSDHMDSIDYSYEWVNIAKYILGVLLNKNNNLNKNEIDFESLINGKSIAIVGPMSTDVNQSKEIMEFDIVVKFNYKDRNSIIDEKFNSSRCDISYFNGSQIHAIIKENQGNLSTKIKYAVIRNHNYESVIDEISKKNNKTIFRKELPFKFLFNKNLTGLPRAIFDLIQFMPSRIKIFNSDLMLTSQRIKNYIPNNSNNTLAESKWLKGASAHDMILQYQLLSLLFTLGKIEGDKIFTRVMQIGIENYLIKMQKNHSLPLTIEQKL